MPSTKHKTKGPSWLAPSLTALISVLLGIFVGQYFSPKNIQFEKRMELKKEIVRHQLPYLMKLRRFAQLGDCFDAVVVQHDSVSESPNMGLGWGDRKVISASIIFFDSSAFEEWRNLSKEITEARAILDPEVYGLFEQIMLFYKRYDSMPDIWDMISNNRTDDIKTFCFMHNILRKRIEALISLE